MVAMVNKMRPFFLWAIRELKVGENILANLCLETLDFLLSQRQHCCNEFVNLTKIMRN